MGFKKSEVAELLAKCKRRCCVCYRFCGVKIELHHIEHKANGGEDKIENAIPLCFECHAEVNHYNDSHPKGRKFTNEELINHKKQWLEVCKNHPEALISAPRDSDVGPLEGMLMELEHNNEVLKLIDEGISWKDIIGCRLRDNEFNRSIEQGSLLLVSDEIREVLHEAYSKIGQINTYVNIYSNTPPEGNANAEATNQLLDSYRKSKNILLDAYKQLNNFLKEVKT